jgi:uncharacterized protein YdeI (YjbR/CyaY-like superfamily)
MTAAGEAAIALARQTGTWNTFSAVEAGEIPPELRKALMGNASAKKHWRTFTASQQRQFLYWLRDAKREQTRLARIAEIVKLVAQGITAAKAYEQKKKLSRPASRAPAASPARRPRQ